MSLPRIVIVMDGGLVQQVLADRPVEVLVVDYDVDGADLEDLTLMPQEPVASEAQTFVHAAVALWGDHTQQAPDRVAQMFAAALPEEN